MLAADYELKLRFLVKHRITTAYIPEVLVKMRDLCKTPPFAQFQRQAQILSLEILNVFLHLKFSPSLNLNKIERFSKVSMCTGGMSNASLKNRLLANRNDRLAWQVNGLKPYPWTLYLKPLRKVSQYIFNKC